MALSLSIPPAELRELDYTTEAPMGNPEYTACLCGHPVKDCKCKPIPVPYVTRLYEFPRVNLDASFAESAASLAESAATAFANGESYDPFAESATSFAKEATTVADEAEECYNCGLFQCDCVFDGYDEEGNPYEYCYSCKGNCMECDCQDFADALLTHSSTATHSISSLHSLQKAYESMGLLPATGWAAELDATATGVADAVAAPVVDTVCDPEEFCDPEFCENCDMSKQDAKCVCDDYESRQAEDHARDQYEEDRFERYGF